MNRAMLAARLSSASVTVGAPRVPAVLRLPVAPCSPSGCRAHSPPSDRRRFDRMKPEMRERAKHITCRIGPQNHTNHGSRQALNTLNPQPEPSEAGFGGGVRGFAFRRLFRWPATGHGPDGSSSDNAERLCKTMSCRHKAHACLTTAPLGNARPAEDMLTRCRSRLPTRLKPTRRFRSTPCMHACTCVCACTLRRAQHTHTLLEDLKCGT